VAGGKKGGEVAGWRRVVSARVPRDERRAGEGDINTGRQGVVEGKDVDDERLEGAAGEVSRFGARICWCG
jgi:hypothetical protein